ncbi:5'/3'-nucleotidase SurE [Psychroflexus aestuariivivens]|uniref:5'/3'-nucleotidase SurE n=1 Tax=Psychroflexus aestuariivivens TaxID=1795040 RepID=UPI000FDAB80D|nr:5'/3'-nucleotidase SurE [Psychroflexus aestuariivivens]
MENQKPLILVTNDDGITAPGIRHLIKIMHTLGEVVVVAPDRPQSGMGHAITINDNLYCDPTTIDKYSDIKEFSCSGTPTDCVKIATQEILKRKPDLCVSGINHGSNSSINVIYSGTMSAAVEAGVEGIPAIGFSLTDYSMEADFEPTTKWVKKITKEVLNNGLPKGVVLNVNFPAIDKIKGAKICRQAKARWQEQFDKRKNPQGRDYYWLAGEFINEDEGPDTDVEALDAGYASIVPIQFDLTAHHFIDEIKTWKING